MRQDFRSMALTAFLCAAVATSAGAQIAPPPPPPPPGPPTVNDTYSGVLSEDHNTTRFGEFTWSTTLTPSGVEHQGSSYLSTTTGKQQTATMRATGYVDNSIYPPASVWSGVVRMHGRAWVRAAGKADWTLVDDSISSGQLGPFDFISVQQGASSTGAYVFYELEKTELIYSVLFDDLRINCDGVSKGFTVEPSGVHVDKTVGLCDGGQKHSSASYEDGNHIKLKDGDEYRMELNLQDDVNSYDFTRTWTVRAYDTSASTGDCQHAPWEWFDERHHNPDALLPNSSCGFNSFESSGVCAAGLCF